MRTPSMLMTRLNTSTMACTSGWTIPGMVRARARAKEMHGPRAAPTYRCDFYRGGALPPTASSPSNLLCRPSCSSCGIPTALPKAQWSEASCHTRPGRCGALSAAGMKVLRGSSRPSADGGGSKALLKETMPLAVRARQPLARGGGWGGSSSTKGRCRRLRTSLQQQWRALSGSGGWSTGRRVPLGAENSSAQRFHLLRCMVFQRQSRRQRK